VVILEPRHAFWATTAGRLKKMLKIESFQKEW